MGAPTERDVGSASLVGTELLHDSYGVGIERFRPYKRICLGTCFAQRGFSLQGNRADSICLSTRGYPITGGLCKTASSPQRRCKYRRSRLRTYSHSSSVCERCSASRRSADVTLMYNPPSPAACVLLLLNTICTKVD